MILIIVVYLAIVVLMIASQWTVFTKAGQPGWACKYRTVSTVHAVLHYSKDGFYLQDSSSSNGTLKFIYQPLQLACNHPVHMKVHLAPLYYQSIRIAECFTCCSLGARSCR